MSVATRERPILFSGPMVKALLAGAKTATRRIVKLNQFHPSDTPGYDWIFRDRRGVWNDYRHADLIGKLCPYGKPGDRLWCKETFAPRLDVDPEEDPEKARHYALYRANGTSLDEPHWHSYPERWTPSIHMPRWASRITLEVTGVRVERLQSITEEDAVAEGVSYTGPCPAAVASGFLPRPSDLARREFAQLWDSLNGRREGCSWAANPWVWAVSFRRIKP